MPRKKNAPDPAKQPAKPREYTLEELCDSITPENRPKEIDWGPAVGNEFSNQERD